MQAQYLPTCLAAIISGLSPIPIAKLWILYDKLCSFALFTSNAATRLESKPPDSRHPIRLSAINRFSTAAESNFRMLLWTSFGFKAVKVRIKHVILLYFRGR